MTETLIKYCKKCVLQEGYSTLVFDEKGVCSDCKSLQNDAIAANLDRYKTRFEDMIDSPKHSAGTVDHDCTVMLSGGKDSIYLLYQLKNVYKKNPLAYTVNHPYESVTGTRSTEHVIKKLQVPHYFFTPDPVKYRKLMKHIFNMETEKVAAIADNHSPEKSPCLVCTYYMMLLGILFSYKMGIQYVVYCADPGQSANLFDDVGEVVDLLYRFCGKELVHEIFGGWLDEMMSDTAAIPRIVFPYSKISYDEDRIIAELNKLGLYDSHPNETHCILFGLLNYFAVKKFKRHFFSVELAMKVRQGKVNRETAIDTMEKFMGYILKIEEKGTAGDELKEKIKRVLQQTGTTEKGIDHLCDSIYNIPDRAREIGVTFGTQSNFMPADAVGPFVEGDAGEFGF